MIFLHKGLQLFQVLLLVDLHLLPKRDCIRMPFGVLNVIVFYTPEAFMLLNVLLHQVVDMISLHDVSVMANVLIIALVYKKNASYLLASGENSLSNV